MRDLFADLMNGFASGGKPQQGGALDVMGDLLGATGAFGGGSKASGGLMDLIGAVSGGASSGPQSVLGGVLGGQANNPMASLLAPFTDSIATKLNIPPAIVTMAAGFLINKLFGAEPTSSGGGGFDAASLLTAMNNGGAGARDQLATSGLTKEFAEHAKIDDKTAGSVLGNLVSVLSGNGVVGKAADKPMGLDELSGLAGLFG
jgi:hypothetical protein